MSKHWKFKRGGIVHGVSLGGINPSLVGRLCDELVARDGKVDPAAFVDSCRPKGHALHDAFEWDDKVCGERWRREQAQGLITAVVIVDTDRPETAAFLHIPDVVMVEGNEEALPSGSARAGGYLPRDVVMQTEEFRVYTLRRAVADLVALRRKYDGLKELASVFGEVDKVISQLGLFEVPVESPKPRFMCKHKNGRGQCSAVVSAEEREQHVLKAHKKRLVGKQLAAWFERAAT